MKKIVPFNKVLKFSDEVSEIKSISLEHNINNKSDMISGEFIVSGNYVAKNNVVGEQEFKFNLPFDIALGINYREDTMVVDIDDFRYELVGVDKLKVDIDLYIDGEEMGEDILDNILDDNVRDVEEDNNNEEVNEIEINNININNNSNLDEVIIQKENNEEVNSIFSPFLDDETYVTYRVYTVMDGDTIDSILEKYNISKDELMKYNDISNIKPMDKLIIPSNEK